MLAVACVLLGFWQLERREARLARTAPVVVNYDRDPVPVDEVLADGGTGAVLPPERRWTPVAVRGTYAPEATVLVRNRPLRRAYGYEVLVPLRLDAASGGGVLLVDRGWVPGGQTSAGPDEVPAPPSGPVEVVARLRQPEPADERGAPAGQVQSIDVPGAVRAELERVDGELAAQLRTGAYAVLAGEDPAPASAPAPLPRPSLDEGPHLSYGVQWLVAAVVLPLLLLTRTRRRLREDAAVAEGAPLEPRRPPRAHPRRRPRDEDEEDALLDAAERARSS